MCAIVQVQLHSAARLARYTMAFGTYTKMPGHLSKASSALFNKQTCAVCTKPQMISRVTPV